MEVGVSRVTITPRRGLPLAGYFNPRPNAGALDFGRRPSAAGRPFFCQCSYPELSPPCTPPPGFAGRHDPVSLFES